MSKIYNDLKHAERSLHSLGMDAAAIGAQLRVKGEISGNEDLQVDGSVEGPIQLGGGKLVVGASGRVTGNVVAREIVVHGHIKGNLRATDRIEIKTAGSIVGDVETARIVIEDGAHFKGSIEIGDKMTEAANAVEKPVRAFAATAAPANSPGI